VITVNKAILSDSQWFGDEAGTLAMSAFAWIMMALHDPRAGKKLRNNSDRDASLRHAVARAVAGLTLILACTQASPAADQPQSPEPGVSVPGKTDPGITAIVTLVDPAQLQPNGRQAHGLDLARVPVLDTETVRAGLAPLLGQPITPAAMQRIRTIILARYRAIGHPFLDVAFPQQDVTNGVLQVVVEEFHLGQVKVDGNKWFSDRQLTGRTGLKPGITIDQPLLERRLEQINSGPFIQLVPEFSPGAAPGTTDVILHAEDHFPVRLSLGYDDSGNASTGLARWNLGAVWGNAFDLGHTLSYQFISSTDFWQNRPKVDGVTPDPRVAGHSGAWQIPLPWGDSLQFSGSYMQQAPVLGPDLGSLGITVQAGLLYAIPLGVPGFADPTKGGSNSLSFGYDYKRTNNNLSFGGVSVTKGFTEIDQFSALYELAVPDRFGRASLQNTLVLSPGNLTPSNRDAAFQPSGLAQSGLPGAHARYGYDRLTATQLTPLPAGFGLQLRATGQLATDTLLSSEQLPLAGADAVRGYEENSITASSGLVASAEIQGPAFSPVRRLLGRDVGDIFQPHIFWDHGQGWNNTASAGVPAHLHTESVGLGARYDLATNLTVRMEQGWQLVRQPGHDANGAFGYVSATASW
jgi:hemolysin activation/secretion protein